MTSVEDHTIPYGSHPEQFGRLSLPDGHGSHPVALLIHGGFWKAAYELDLMAPLAVDLVARGHAVWNIEYRRVSGSDRGAGDRGAGDRGAGDSGVGGGYPHTLLDVAAATDHLASMAVPFELDLDRLAVIGHSAGGHLALWVGSRHLLPSGSPGAEPVVRPRVVVGQAAVTDLAAAANDGLGTKATQRFLGGEPDDVPDAYAAAQPVLGATSTLLVSGDNDENVPVDYTMRWSDVVEIAVVEGEDHFDVIDPTSASWQIVIEAIERARS